MKFWQKAFISMLLIFVIGFDVTVYLLAEKSYELSKSNEISTAESEHFIIRKSISDRISAISENYTSLNTDNLEPYIMPYGQYYENQKIFIELYQNDTLLYSSFEHALPERADLSVQAGEKSIWFHKIDGISYLFITSVIDSPNGNMKFSFIKDVTALTSYRKEIIRYSVMISAVVSICLSFVIISMLLNLTRPIRRLNKAAGEIAGGNYEKRVFIKSHDEIGAFAENFNLMVDSVEAHVQKLSLMTEEKQRFIDNLSHELRTPTAAILGYGEFLKNANCNDEERVTATNYIINQSQRLQSLSTKLMQLASMNRSEIILKVIDLREVISSVRATLYESYTSKGIVIVTQLPYFRMMGDADLLESLLQNLLENAIRALPENGLIEVFTEKDNDLFYLTVKDNGPGMVEAEQRKIMEPFYRIDKSRSRSHGGAGLGLAICKQICDLHKAELIIASTLNHGTKVSIVFTSMLQLDDDSVI